MDFTLGRVAFLLATAACSLTFGQEIPAEPEKDLLAFANGALVVAAPKDTDNASMAYTPYNMIDEAVNSGWRSETDAVRDQVFVFALAERCVLKKLGFDALFRSGVESGPKDVLVEMSDTSATAGFQPVLTAVLEETDDQNFPVERAVPGRWVRLTIKNNHGNEHYIELSGFRGYGEALSQTATLTGLSGTYEMNSGLGIMRLKQEGTAVTGCYTFRKGMVTGGVEGRILKATLTETDELTGEKDEQTAFFTLVGNGREILGFTRRPDREYFDACWHGPKASEDIGDCPHIPGWKKKESAAGSRLEQSLKEEKRARVYGINFDFNSHVIRAESLSLLAQIAAMLKQHGDWRMTIEGHTDGVGGETYNQGLSDRRAGAVVAYLTGQGIPSSQLTAQGFGLTRPVAPNNTSAGRAQNRRVELVRQ